MATRIRLQRHGRKGRPFYWIVIADSRAKRDGKFIEKIGTYNPISNPAQIDLNADAAVKWLHNGAQPSETARRLLSYKGVLLRHHLEIGVRKGAMTSEEAENKFQTWLDEKSKKIDAKVQKLQRNQVAIQSKHIQQEKEYREAKTVGSATSAEETPTPKTQEVVPSAEQTAAEEIPKVDETKAEVSKTENTTAPSEEKEESEEAK